MIADIDKVTALDFIKKNDIDTFEPKQELLIPGEKYTIKTASTEDEFIKTFQLRFKVYGEYYLTPPPVELDIDKFDKYADHIIIIDNVENKVIGTYRVLCTDFTKDLYTGREFDLSSLVGGKDKIVEMGRATVSPDARRGAVIALLWRGLGEYIAKIKADYLLGCATIWTQDFNRAVEVWQYLKQKNIFFDKKVPPLEPNIVPNWSSLIDKSRDLSEEEMAVIGKSLPPLMKSYVKAGAKFGDVPANDAKLQAVDFFTICKVTELSENLIKKYL